MRAEPLGPLFLELYNKDSKKVATGKEVAAGIRIRHPTTHPAKNPRSAMARAKAPTRLRREWSAPWWPNRRKRIRSKESEWAATRFVWICSRLDKMLQLKANQLINNNIT